MADVVPFLVGVGMMGTVYQRWAPQWVGDLGLILLLCGLGSWGGWFPFVRLAGERWTVSTSIHALWRRGLPLLATGGLVAALAKWGRLNPQQTTLLGIVGLFVILQSSVRLSQEQRLSRRTVLTATSILGWLLLAACLMAWEATHPKIAWHNTSNFPSAGTLFVSAICCEAVALLLVVCCYHLLNQRGDDRDNAELLHGSLRTQPWPSSILLMGELSLSGVPPWPGFWWRWTLLAAMFLPHLRNSISGLAEPSTFFAWLAIGSLCVWMISLLARIGWLARVAFDEPFRARSNDWSWRGMLVLSLVLLGFVWFTVWPLSIGPAMTGWSQAEATE
ncbi:MAG: hypothetical protein KDA80_01960 [Planctomycetaceae bacterium]|nr:hypothetical protein [Planctomycetaceae bacterium]